MGPRLREDDGVVYSKVNHRHPPSNACCKVSVYSSIARGKMVVSPQFLGMLRKLLDPRLASVVSLEINKDYTQFSPEKLLEQLKTYKEKG